VTAPLAFEESPETSRGRMLYGMLLAVHGHIRGDLIRLERLAEAVVGELSTDELEHELEELRNNTMLWQFQISCLRWCGLVHLHHNAEDVEFFDELEETNPALGPVVERLRAEHREVSNYLDAVEAAARTLSGNDSLGARGEVADALEALAAHLLAHLEYEEQNVAATTRRLPELSSPRVPASSSD
jgi:Hemerythrin HHE cation binding domain